MTISDTATSASSPEAIGFGERLRQLAAERGDAAAVTTLHPDGSETVTSWQELDIMVDRIAGVLQAEGAGPGTVAGIGLRNGLSHIATVLACWRSGSTTLVFDPATPAVHASRILATGSAVLAVTDKPMSLDGIPAIEEPMLIDRAKAAGDRPIREAVPTPGKIVSSGGSTGLPKLMRDDRPWVKIPGRTWGNIAPALGFRPNQVQLVSGAMSHNAPLTWAHMGLFEGHHLVVMEKFSAEGALSAIDRHGVEFAMVVPTMMVRMLDALSRNAYDLTSLQALYHTGAPCAPWLKRAWIEAIGPERVFEMYGSGENVGQTIITGSEWLEHPGSVGRPFETDAIVLDETGARVPPHVVGELHMRLHVPTEPVRYINPGAAMKRTPDGFTSIGDMAYLDEDGYVFLAGRRDDAINTGGVKVHPERIEAAILSHPGVADAVVFGIADRMWGEAVHAVVELKDPAVSIDVKALQEHCANQLSPAETPKSLAILPALPRDGFGKIKRKQMRLTAAAESQR